MKLLSDDDLKLMDTHLRRRLDELLISACPQAAELSRMNRQIAEYTLAGGKRVRPQLTSWTFRHFSAAAPAALPPCVLDAGCVWELFHAFLLIHDDIIDASDTRRDMPSLHRSLAEVSGVPRGAGEHLAIVAGDLLFSVALRLLHNVDCDPAAYKQLLQIFSRVACETGFGQAVDICVSHVPMSQVCEESLLREYHWKTAAYTFEGPMLFGAALAGASAKTQATISNYALALGQAYQMQNDLIDLARPIATGSDLVQGKRTITLIRARNELEPGTRAAFDETLSQIARGGERALGLAEELRQSLLSGKAVLRTRQAVADLLATAAEASECQSIPPQAAQALKQLLEALRRSYFAGI